MNLSREQLAATERDTKASRAEFRRLSDVVHALEKELESIAEEIKVAVLGRRG